MMILAFVLMLISFSKAPVDNDEPASSKLGRRRPIRRSHNRVKSGTVKAELLDEISYRGMCRAPASAGPAHTLKNDAADVK